MPLGRLTLTRLNAAGNPAGDPITVRYNPEEYTVGQDNNFAVHSVPGMGSPLVQFVNGNQRTLDLELFFDTYDTAFPVKKDVREETRQITGLMELDSALHAPPVIAVAMAGFRFQGVLSRVSQRFVLFMPDGTPVRARLNCSFIEYVDPERAARAANLQTADFSKAHLVSGDETLSSIAYVHYDDPTLWRPIAIANEIADPRSIVAGQMLLIPALPYVDPRDREVVT